MFTSCYKIGKSLLTKLPPSEHINHSFNIETVLIILYLQAAAHSTPRQNGHTHTPPLPSIPEMEIIPEPVNRKQPPPTLPKPKKPTKVTPPAPPPKPKLKPVSPTDQENGSDNFQDETCDGSEV